MKTYLKYPRILAADLATLSPKSIVAKFERGDSDTSASTIRTAGAVFLVVIVVAGIVTAVKLVGDNVAAKIGAVTWDN